MKKFSLFCQIIITPFCSWNAIFDDLTLRGNIHFIHFSGHLESSDIVNSEDFHFRTNFQYIPNELFHLNSVYSFIGQMIALFLTFDLFFRFFFLHGNLNAFYDTCSLRFREYKHSKFVYHFKVETIIEYLPPGSCGSNWSFRNLTRFCGGCSSIVTQYKELRFWMLNKIAENTAKIQLFNISYFSAFFFF